MRNVAQILALVSSCGVLVSPAWADPSWSLEVLVGDAFNADSHTHIERAQGHAEGFDGDYDTRGLEGPLHYTVRIARWYEDRAWELQLLHHKLYLQNRPAGVESLSVSHGFNVVSLNRVYAMNAWRFRIGVGPVVAHPEARIDGVSYNGPYELAGAAALGGVGAEITLAPQLSLVGEIAATYGYVDVHPDGDPKLEFSIRNPAIHAQIGLGYRF